MVDILLKGGRKLKAQSRSLTSYVFADGRNLKTTSYSVDRMNWRGWELAVNHPRGRGSHVLQSAKQGTGQERTGVKPRRGGTPVSPPQILLQYLDNAYYNTGIMNFKGIMKMCDMQP